jgi:4-carboxymuconolactone decarboxylase
MKGSALPDPSLDLPLRSSADTEGDVQRVLSKLESSGHDLKINRVLANSSAAFRPYMMLASALLNNAALPAAEREIVILHLAARRHVTYEWDEHVPMSVQAGVSDDQRGAIESGQTADQSLFSPSEQLAIRVADAIVDERSLGPEVWEEMKAHWGLEGGLDLILTVAFWGGFVPTVIESVGLQHPS